MLEGDIEPGSCGRLPGCREHALRTVAGPHAMPQRGGDQRTGAGARAEIDDILGIALRQHFPSMYGYFGQRGFAFRGRTIKGHNKVLDMVAGADGIKTGYTRAAGFNLTASAQLSRFAVKHWQERGFPGRIVHVASRAGHRGDSPAHWHYAASKGGMLAMHKTIARQYAHQGILSFAITPGFTDTAMAGDYLESRGGAGLLADIPLGRVAEPEEMARIITFCALDAPASMTGATLDANGASYVR